MAKKKSKKQLKEERRRAMERKRRETGWEPPLEPDMEQERLMADMIPLLGGAEGEDIPPEVVMMPLMELILDSDHLIEEPEFDGVYAPPLLCVEAFGEAIADRDLEDISPHDLSTDEQEEVYLELIEETVSEVLTPELEEALLSALQALRERARKEDDEDLVAQAASVYAFLDEMSAEIWINVGVVQAVVQRSLSAGMEMYDVVEEIAERAAAGKGRPGLLRRLIGATPEQKMEHVLAKYPGLEAFMTDQVQDDWEAGADALTAGELDLGLFSEAEISAALEEMRSLGIKLAGQGGLLVPDSGSEEEKARTFALWLGSYVKELATPERREQMQARLGEFAEDAGPSELAFLSLANGELEGEEMSARLLAFLARALVGEMQNFILKREEAEE